MLCVSESIQIFFLEKSKKGTQICPELNDIFSKPFQISIRLRVDLYQEIEFTEFQEYETNEDDNEFSNPLSIETHPPGHNFTGPGTLINRIYEVNPDNGEEEREEEKIINAGQSFKSNECVINVLFCNCGHMCICVKCDRVKSLETCPVCKTENTIKQTII